MVTRRHDGHYSPIFLAENALNWACFFACSLDRNLFGLAERGLTTFAQLAFRPPGTNPHGASRREIPLPATETCFTWRPKPLQECRDFNFPKTIESRSPYTYRT